MSQITEKNINDDVLVKLARDEWYAGTIVQVDTEVTVKFIDGDIATIPNDKLQYVILIKEKGTEQVYTDAQASALALPVIKTFTTNNTQYESVVEIACDRLAKFQEHVAKLNKRLARYSSHPIEVIVGKKVSRELRTYDQKATAFAYLVTIKGEIVKLGDYKIVAKINHSESPVKVTVFEGGFAVPKNYIDKSSCEHCDTNRMRNTTYVLRGKDDVKQVGSSCLELYTGVSPSAAIGACSVYDLLNEALILESSWFGSEGSNGGYNGDIFDTMSWLYCSASIIRTQGYVSATTAYETGATPTREYVRTLYYKYMKAQMENNTIPEISTKDIEVAKEAVDFYKKLDVADDEHFNFMCQAIANSDRFTEGNAGIATYIPQGYLKSQYLKQKAERDKNSQWRGTVGTREGFTLIVDKITERLGDYGITYIHVMHDMDGNYFVWYSSSERLEEGHTYQVMAKVKKHDEYKGAKQTVISYVKVIKKL